MMAQVAISYGDAMNAFKLTHEDHSFVDSVELLAMSPKYKDILPAALAVYTENGARIGAAIASYPEFDHRTTVARELADIVENNYQAAMTATENLENPHIKEQLSAVENQFPHKYNFGSNPAIDLTIRQAVYGQSEITDMMIEKASGSSELISALQLAIEGYNAENYRAIVDEIFSFYAELKDKDDLSAIDPGIKVNDLGLVKAIRSFTNKYNSMKNKDWTYSLPKFNKSADRYAWDDNTFADTVRRAETLFETGRAAFVDHVIQKMNDSSYARLGRTKISERPEDVLDAAEKIKDAKLPEEVYIALGTEFGGTSLVKFANSITKEPVLNKLRAIDKMGPHLAKAAIGYAACRESPEDVSYIAENILKLSQFGKAKQLFKNVMYAARRSAKGAEQLRSYLPEGIDIRKLSKEAKLAVILTGNKFRDHRTVVHKIISENPGILENITKDQLSDMPYIYSGDSSDVTEVKIKNWFGLEEKEKSKKKKKS